MKHKSLRKQQGQGLIEILIVAVIITIASVALIQFQAMIAYRDSLALQRSDATQLAMQEIEQLRNFQVLTTQLPYAAYSSIASGSSTSVGTNTTYTITWTVTPNATYTYDNVSVAVTWTDMRNNSQTVTLVSNIAGLQPVFSATVLY